MLRNRCNFPEISVYQAFATLFAQLQQQQNQNSPPQAGSNVRQIPMIRNLDRAEDLESWREELVQMLKRYGLAKYIESELPQPEDHTARRQWLRDRLDVDAYIQTTVPNEEIWNSLRERGWSAADMNPKRTFDFVVRYFHEVSPFSRRDRRCRYSSP
ncbi:hypothetical protein N656DRAFT_503510 [Canariomyces notabilis]|uniref:Uncharacterized protein n=1 Tax=Canariomyces notabilis TaxID=2074819 RepID=A0AAN6QHN5_9PEZI|nr:hypothetical protein N656DRAFT_503510 [Canariomyces arenarius]